MSPLNHCLLNLHILQNEVQGFRVSCFPEVPHHVESPVVLLSQGTHSPCILLLLWKTASLLSTEFGSVQKCLMFSSKYQLWFSSTRVNMITNSRSTSVLIPEYLFNTPFRNTKRGKKRQLEVNQTLVRCLSCPWCSVSLTGINQNNLRPTTCKRKAALVETTEL